MSDEGEKTCPLCAEEMDLTDQQLKPCKCGYEICVWCWHHIMDMAEKDDTEGRCPACRTPYNKEKIVGTAAQCERLVAEMSVEKKQKSQKGKIKTSEGRKQLSSVRVIQRNLVYIVGLPLNLADEDLLQRKEYFGQYGKVLKVSISRTAAGTIQHFANNTCSVYITYSREEEAVRSIQSVHGFVLEGRPLRACFGTTKYCHSWLRNVPCTNPDCLYLHEIGSQEDSFTKDEIISAYTRVQQITGAATDMQRRSGNLLPPPADDYSNNSTSTWGKPISRSTTNAPVSAIRSSPPNSSSGRSGALPAAASWGTRTSNSLSLAANVSTSNGPSKYKAETCNSTLSFSTAVVSPVLHGSEIVKKHSEETPSSEQKGKLEPPESVKPVTGTDHRRTLSETPIASGVPSTSSLSSHLCTASPKDKSKSINMVPNFSTSLESSRQSSVHFIQKDVNATEEKILNLSSDISLMSLDRNKGLHACDAEQVSESLASNKVEKPLKPSKDISITREHSDMVSEMRPKVAEVAVSEAEDDFLSFNNQRLRDPEVVIHPSYVQNLPQSTNNSMGYPPQQGYGSINNNSDPPFVDQKFEKTSLPHTFSMPVVNGYSSSVVGSYPLESSNGHPLLVGNEGSRTPVGKFEDAATAKVDNNTALDLGESRIISNILSMDFDPWDESLTSPQNLAKLFGENDKQQGYHRVSSSWKAQSSNQSRFSFAREDEYRDQGSNLTPSQNDLGPGLMHRNLSHDFITSRDIYLDKHSDGNGFSSFSFEESDNVASNYSPMSANKLSVSRSQISAPPGFSGPSRAPPPGFTSHERIEHTFDNLSGNQIFDASSLLRKQHQAPPSVNSGSAGELEFMDPAILAVGVVGSRVPVGLNSPGLDMRPNFPAQISSFENEARLQLLMQRSFAPQQNQRFTELGDNFPQRTDAYGIPSRIMEQTLPNNRLPYQQSSFQQPRSSMMTNGHWDGWNEVQTGNDIAVAELLRNERLGFNKYYPGYEDAKFRMPNSTDLYNRTFGI